MTGEERERITSDDYADVIVEYRTNPQLLESFENATIHIMNDFYAVVHIPAAQLQERLANFIYAELPILFGLTDENSLEASGVFELRNIPAFNLRGEGVAIGIIDTGIDYTNPIFLRPDGSTKIISIWDQTIESANQFPDNAYFGTEYGRDQINQALASENPFEIVPSRDVNGHGTRMAGIAAGNDMEDAEFFGVAPDAELIVVKLRQAKQSLRDFFLIPENVECFQENHVMWAVQYCSQVARLMGQPLVICLGIGSSQGAHAGRSPLAVTLNITGTIPGTAIITAVGNEGNMGRHYYGVIDPAIGSNTVEINVGENDRGFSMELWGDPPGIYSIDLLSPSGEYIPRIPPGLRVNRVISFIFESTVIFVTYQLIETQTGGQLILIRFQDATPGIWRFNVYGHGDLATGFHMWLPMGDFISGDTYFIQPNIYTTVLSPATAANPISVTAYNPVNGNLYVNSSRGYTRANVIKPEIAAPGVNYLAPTLEQTFDTFTGTSVAAAHTAGIAAMLLEWGTVRGNQPGMDSGEIKNYLIRGAERRQNLTYPNRDWGYGILDIFNVFDIMRADTGNI